MEGGSCWVLENSSFLHERAIFDKVYSNIDASKVVPQLPGVRSPEDGLGY